MAPKINALLFLILFPLVAIAEGEKKFVIDADSSAEFLAVGRPSMIKINGTGGKVQGKFALDGAKSIGEITLDLRDFTTGMQLRDKHMK